MKKTGNQSLPRRHFLQQLLLVGGATGASAALLASTRQTLISTNRQSIGDKASDQGKGYRLTEHIRTYYDKARI